MSVANTQELRTLCQTKDDPKKAEELIKAGANMTHVANDRNLCNKENRPLLNIAAAKGFLGIIRVLVANGYPIEMEEVSNRVRALHAAAEHMQPEACKLLVELGANLEAKQYMGNTPLLLAAMNWSDEFPHEAATKTCQMLLKLGANINAHNGQHTALHLAAYKGNISLVKLLVENKIDINAVAEKKTPLSRAAEYGKEDIIDFLLANGATYTSDVIFQAVSSQNTGLLRKILALDGMDVNITSGEGTSWRKGCTPLMCAVSSDYREGVEMLLAKGADVQMKDKQGLTALGYSAIRGFANPKFDNQLRIFKILFDAGVPVNVKAVEYNSKTEHDFFHRLMAYPLYLPLVQLFIEYKYNVNTVNEQGKTPLVCAIEASHIKAMNLLISSGADIEQANNAGNRPLHIASVLNRPHLMKILQDAGADSSAKNGAGQTPSALALSFGPELCGDSINFLGNGVLPAPLAASGDLNLTLMGSHDSGKELIMSNFANHLNTDAFPSNHYEYESRADKFIVNINDKESITVVIGSLNQPRSGYFQEQLFDYYVTNTQIIVYVFSVVKPENLQHITKFWMPIVKKSKAQNAPYFVVGTDIERRDAKGTPTGDASSRVVTRDQGVKFAEDIGAVKYFECSNETQVGLTALYNTLLKSASETPGARPKSWTGGCLLS